MFYVVLLVLAVAASLFVLVPLYARRKQADTHRDDINRALYRQRVAEIEDNSLLSDEEQETLKAEAGRDLLADTSRDAEKTGWQFHARSKQVFIAAALLIPLVAFVFYLDAGLGRGNITDHRLALDMRDLDPTNQQDYLEMVDRVAERALHQPDNTELQFLLGQMLTSVGRYDEATRVYETLQSEFPTAPEVASRLAEALFLADERRWSERVAAAVDTALDLNPNDVTMIEIRAMAAVSEGKPEEALDWLRQAKRMDVTGRRAQLIDTAIRQLEQQLGIASAPEGSGRSIHVTLSASDSVTLPPETAVFVYARAAQGPPAPLAVQKVFLSDLPATIVLDESMAMVQGLSLAEFDEVMLIARASKSGDVVPAAGDYEVRSSEISLESGVTELSLTINDPL